MVQSVPVASADVAADQNVVISTVDSVSAAQSAHALGSPILVSPRENVLFEADSSRVCHTSFVSSGVW